MMRPKETDARRIAQRKKQIELGKSTRGYHTYTSLVPRGKRHPSLAFSKHPITPNPLEKCSKRRFDGKLRVWRRGIHTFEEEYASGNLTAVVGSSEHGAPTAGPRAVTESKEHHAAKPCYAEHGSAGKDSRENHLTIQLKTAASQEPCAQPRDAIASFLSASVLTPVEDNKGGKSYSAAVKRKTPPGGTDTKCAIPRRYENPRQDEAGNQMSRFGRRTTGTNGANKSRFNSDFKAWKSGRFPPRGSSGNNVSAGGGKSAINRQQSGGGGIVCSGGVCALPVPDVRNSNNDFLPFKSRQAAAVVRERNILSEIGNLRREQQGQQNGQRREVFPVPQRPHTDGRRSYKEARAQAEPKSAGGQRPPSSYLAEDGADVLSKGFVQQQQPNGAAAYDPPPGPYRVGGGHAVPTAPKCARFNDGACNSEATRCAYRHEVWTFGERVEYEARQAFADNSRLLEQNSVLLNRLREQDAVIVDQSAEISNLLEEIHHLRLSSVRRHRVTRNDAAYDISAGENLGDIDMASAACAATPRFAAPLGGGGVGAGGGGSSAAAVAATALRRTPLRASSSRGSFARRNSFPRGDLHQAQLLDFEAATAASATGAVHEIAYPVKVQPEDFTATARSNAANNAKHVYANVFDADVSAAYVEQARPSSTNTAKSGRRTTLTPRKETPRAERYRARNIATNKENDPKAAALATNATRTARGPSGGATGFDGRFTKAQQEEATMDKGTWLIKNLARA